MMSQKCSKIATLGELLAKNKARTARRQLDGRHLLWRIFVELNNSMSPNLVNKTCTMQNELSIKWSGGKHVLAC